ncbi:MAG: ATP-binding protein [Myxococcaceae bacterium]
MTPHPCADRPTPTSPFRGGSRQCISTTCEFASGLLQVWTLELVVSVSDTGEGIHLRHLFQPFFSTRRAGDGTGFGLTLSRRIVQRHQGRMEVATEEGLDSTFSVFLPLRLRVEPPEPWQPPLPASRPEVVLRDRPHTSGLATTSKSGISRRR